jgi:hypothetical protein
MTPLRFYNLDEAFSYRRSCPLCREPVFPIDVNMKYDYDGTKADFTVGESTFQVSCSSNELTYHTRRNQHDQMVTFGASQSYIGMTRSSYGLHNGGTDIFKMEMRCHKCERYRYVVQVHLSLDEKRITDLVLNSEAVIIEDGAKLCTIKNVYTTEKTELIVRHQHVSQYHEPLEKIEFPLVPINLEDPRKTLERIRKLVVFL